MKKALSILIVLALMMSLAIPAFAAGDGKITITGVHKGNTYAIYKILDLSHTVIGGEDKYSYTVKEPWKAFFTSAEAAPYVSVDAGNHVTWKPSADAAAFAKLALAYAKANSIAALASQTASSDGVDLVFDGLELGYYLIDSTMGALCGLTTTDPYATVNAKNGVPTLDKQVQEDSIAANPGAGSPWFDHNTADIGQEVFFEVTINVHAGAENYIFHDVMSAGLTYNGVDSIVHMDTSAGTTTDVPASYYTLKESGCTDGCTFEIVFTQTFCDHLEINDKIVIKYSAILNENAAVGASGNENTAKLSFGENSHYETSPSVTKTYTYGFDVVKVDGSKTLLNGAKFELYNQETGGTPIQLFKKSEGVYRLAKAGEAGAITEFEVKDGKIRIEGFDNGAYYLEETKAPEGYNLLLTRQKFTIADTNLDMTLGADGKPSTGTGIQVVNLSGNVLPETGAMGTLLFTALGGAVVTGSGVLLVTKKRVSKYEDEE